jgi:hypothetical protein
VSVSTVKDIKFNACKSTFLSKLTDIKSLPQCQELENFIQAKKITDVCRIYTPSIAITDSSMIALIVNDRYRSLDELNNIIRLASQHAVDFFYLAVNKFYIYSNKDLEPSTVDNYDQLLVDYCYNLVKDQFNLITSAVRPDDDGSPGNFIHPVTTLLMSRRG